MENIETYRQKVERVRSSLFNNSRIRRFEKVIYGNKIKAGAQMSLDGAIEFQLVIHIGLTSSMYRFNLFLNSDEPKDSINFCEDLLSIVENYLLNKFTAKISINYLLDISRHSRGKLRIILTEQLRDSDYAFGGHIYNLTKADEVMFSNCSLDARFNADIRNVDKVSALKCAKKLTQKFTLLTFIFLQELAKEYPSVVNSYDLNWLGLSRKVINILLIEI